MPILRKRPINHSKFGSTVLCFRHSVNYVCCIGRRGDLNSDGDVTATDAVIVLQIAAGAVHAVLVGDMNGDSKVTSLDALMIVQVAAGVK